MNYDLVASWHKTCDSNVIRAEMSLSSPFSFLRDFYGLRSEVFSRDPVIYIRTVQMEDYLQKARA